MCGTGVIGLCECGADLTCVYEYACVACTADWFVDDEDA